MQGSTVRTGRTAVRHRTHEPPILWSTLPASESSRAVGDTVQQPERRRSTARRAFLGAASPLVGYFDRRFQDLHDHIDNQPALDRLADDLRNELSRTRTDVATDTDTIAELAFTLERFADLFTARMEDLAAQFSAARVGLGDEGSSIVELPFAFAAVADLERGASVAAIGDRGPLAIGLAALGLHVTALETIGAIAHPDVATVEDPLDTWAGPGEPYDAAILLTPAVTDYDIDDARAKLDRVDKWLRPTGLVVLAVRFDAERGLARSQIDELFSDWNVEREAYFEPDSAGAWRRSSDEAIAGVALVRAAPRA